MTGLIDWATSRARMIFAFVALSIGAGALAYVGLPKEGAPNIDIPVLYVSTSLPGAAPSDIERLVIKPLETELRDLEGLKQLTSFATQGHSGVLLEFDFGFEKSAAVADARDRVERAQAEMPADAERSTVTETNLSAFPVLTVALAGDVPERTLLRVAKDLQRRIETLTPVLEAPLAGHRDEMIEIIVDPLKLEAFDIAASELVEIVQRNNRLVAAGALETPTGKFSISVPGAFDSPQDAAAIPIKTDGDRIVTLRDLADIRRGFEDAQGRARFNGRPAIALEVKKRAGENIIETIDAVRTTIAAARAEWPAPLAEAVTVDYALDQSREVVSMVAQLENSVLTAVMLVMIVVVAALGLRSALLVGLAVPCSFLLAFALLAALGMTVSNMVMFGLILAVGMLVDGAIVVAEDADRRIAGGTAPRSAYASAAKRMFWPIVTSTATTLCAFLPMLFWPGLAGQFMSLLPITLIFVLSASLLVALIYLPVVGGAIGEAAAAAGRLNARLAAKLFRRRAAASAQSAASAHAAPGADPAASHAPAPAPTLFGRAIGAMIGNPIGPFVTLALAAAALTGAFALYGEYGRGAEFFVEVEPERALVHVRARGNLSLDEKDALVAQVEERLEGVDGVRSVFAFSGAGGLTVQGDEGPPDSVGRLQIEFENWETRFARGLTGQDVLADIRSRLGDTPGAVAELVEQKEGPEQGKPIQLEIAARSQPALDAAAEAARRLFEATPGLISVDDTRPLPGIEFTLSVDREAAGRFGADVAQIGAMVQLVTRGVILDQITPDDSDDEIDIVARFPEAARNLTTLLDLRMRTSAGLVPVSNFTSLAPEPKIGQIARRDGRRFYLVRADVTPDQNALERISALQKSLDALAAEQPALFSQVEMKFVGDQEEQAETMTFLGQAFIGALGLMFVILLAQFNSVYNSLLVLSAVVMSLAGVLIGMVVMDQKFSIIMTGTGVVALAGIVVNNNIVLIDAFQEHARRLPPLEAIRRAAEDRLRPVLLTTVTTIAGLTPMVFAASIDFFDAAISIGAPTALWWVQLATAVVFGLAFSTLLTLMVTPAALAARVWVARGLGRLAGAGEAASPTALASSPAGRRSGDAQDPDESVRLAAE